MRIKEGNLFPSCEMLWSALVPARNDCSDDVKIRTSLRWFRAWPFLVEIEIRLTALELILSDLLSIIQPIFQVIDCRLGSGE